MLENIYKRLPRVVQNEVLSLKGLMINRKRYSDTFYLALETLEANSFTEENSLIKYHENCFQKLLENVSQNALASSRFEELYGPVKDFSSLSDLKALGKVSKQQIKQVLLKYPIEANEKKWVNHTSGTTGSGLIYPTTSLSDAYQWAVWWRYRRKHSISFDTVCGYFGGRSIVNASERKCFYRYNRSAKQVMFSAYHLNSKTVCDYVDGIRKHNVTWLHGYPSFLANFASLCVERNIDVSNLIDKITIGSESLLPFQKSLIEKVFSCIVIQHYGLSEGVANISESIDGKLVVDEDYSIVEFEEIGDGTHRIIGSNLYNSAMPMLKYDTSDVVHGISKSGDLFRSVDSIDGRVEDYLVLSDGTKIGRLDHIFKDIYQIKEAQIYQHSTNKVTFNIVKGFDYTSSVEERIKKEFFNRVDKDIDLKFNYTDEIKKTKSGKLRFVISNIS